MAINLARSYGIVVLICNLVLGSIALVLHLGFLVTGRSAVSAAFVSAVFRLSVLAVIAGVGFIKDSLRWKEQVKSCPQWMWRAGLGLGIYALLMFCLESIFSPGPSLYDRTLTFSAFPLAGDAISGCVLYSALWGDYVKRSELPKMAGASAGILASVAFLFLLDWIGVWPHHSRGMINSN